MNTYTLYAEANATGKTRSKTEAQANNPRVEMPDIGHQPITNATIFSIL